MNITGPQHFACAQFPVAASEKQVPRYADRLRDPLRFGMTFSFINVKLK
jgi:hypothetical protein